MNKRNYLIDLLRFFAAAWVALFHFNEPVKYIDNWYRAFLKSGYLGVPVFFVISGYCVYLAAENSKTATDFIIRRFFRIFPPYWFSLFIVMATILVSMIIHHVNDLAVLPKTIPTFLATVTLLTAPFFDIKTINWVYWTLTFEIFFYIVIWVSLLFPVQYKSLWLILIAIITLLLPVHYYWPLFFIKHWPEFCIGLVTYRLLHDGTKEIVQNVILLVLSFAGLFMIPQLQYYPEVSIITALLITLNHFKPLKKNPLSILGDYSYSIYLLHVPIGVYLLGKIKQKQYVQSNLWLNIVWDIALLSVIILLSKLMYMKVELPSIALGKKYKNGIRKTAV